MVKIRAYTKEIVDVPDNLHGEDIHLHLQNIYGKRKLIRWEVIK